MPEQPGLFPPLYSASVAAGERAGRLADVLERLADFAEKREEMKRGISLALIYPAALALIAVTVAWGLISHVVPRGVGAVEQTSNELAMLTRSIMALSDLVTRQWRVRL